MNNSGGDATVLLAALDELYLWLGNLTAVEYIRNCLKRVRKRNSAMLLASQNLVDFDQPRVREMTKPMFAIPPHQFLFNPGSIGKEAYMDMLQLEDSEYVEAYKAYQVFASDFIVRPYEKSRLAKAFTKLRYASLS